MFAVIYFLYMILAFCYGIFGTFALMLGMTQVSLLGIWIWFLVPFAIDFIYTIGKKIDKSMSRRDYF